MQNQIRAQHRAPGIDSALGSPASAGQTIGNWPDPMHQGGMQPAF